MCMALKWNDIALVVFCYNLRKRHFQIKNFQYRAPSSMTRNENEQQSKSTMTKLRENEDTDNILTSNKRFMNSISCDQRDQKKNNTNIVCCSLPDNLQRKKCNGINQIWNMCTIFCRLWQQQQQNKNENEEANCVDDKNLPCQTLTSSTFNKNW